MCHFYIFFLSILITSSRVCLPSIRDCRRTFSKSRRCHLLQSRLFHLSRSPTRSRRDRRSKRKHDSIPPLGFDGGEHPKTILVRVLLVFVFCFSTTWQRGASEERRRSFIEWLGPHFVVVDITIISSSSSSSSPLPPSSLDHHSPSPPTFYTTPFIIIIIPKPLLNPPHIPLPSPLLFLFPFFFFFFSLPTLPLNVPLNLPHEPNDLPNSEHSLARSTTFFQTLFLLIFVTS